MQQSDTPLLITTLRVKKPKFPCMYCKENLQTKTALDSHILCCKLIHKQPIINDNDIPSMAAFYKMHIELVKEVESLKKENKEILSRLPKNKEKIRFLDWLNNNRKCNQTFQQLKTNIIIKQDMMINLFHDKSIYDILDKLLQDYLSSPTENPIIALEQEQNKFYIFQEEGWALATKEMIAKFLQKIHLDICHAFYNWKKTIKREDDAFNIQCNKIENSILAINFEENPSAYSKGKTILWKLVKQLFQATTEYEFVYE